MRWFLAGLLLFGALMVAATPSTVAAQAANEVEIIIDSGGFSPNPATIPPGHSAVWCNDDTADHSIVIDGRSAYPTLEPGDCLDPVTLESGSYPYHDGHNAATTGTVVFQAPPPTTTTATTAGATTTVVATATTRRTTTTARPVIRRSATTRTTSRATTSTSIVEPTTTSEFFETTTTEFTTSTFGAFAINEPEGGGGDTGTALAIVAGLAALGGAGYLGYRYRYRFIR